LAWVRLDSGLAPGLCRAGDPAATVQKAAARCEPVATGLCEDHPIQEGIMPSSEARVLTEHASKYLQQLCKHFGHRIPATFDADSGHLTFEMGTTALVAAPALLVLRNEAPDAAGLTRLEGVIASHLVRFAFREELKIDWKPV
jgi:hypothetical protein